MSSEKSEIFIIALSMVQYALTAQVVETVNFLLISTYFGARIIAYHLNLRRSSPRTVCGTHTIKTIHYYIELTVPSPMKS